MMIDSRKIISVTEANKDFSRTAKIADTYVDALVFNDNRPKYEVTNLELEPDFELTDDEKIDVVAKRILARYRPAFLELAK